MSDNGYADLYIDPGKICENLRETPRTLVLPDFFQRRSAINEEPAVFFK